VIEFPAVLLDTSNGEVKEEFHAFVLPTEQPRLSEFCTSLTGITQRQVESGAPLATTLLLFDQWMKSISAKYKMVVNDVIAGFESATFVTWYVRSSKRQSVF
jgi:ERI1 exoribonuclease 2